MKTTIKKSVILNGKTKRDNLDLRYDLMIDSMMELHELIDNKGNFLISMSNGIISNVDYDMGCVEIHAQKLPEHATEIIIK